MKNDFKNDLLQEAIKTLRFAFWALASGFVVLGLCGLTTSAFYALFMALIVFVAGYVLTGFSKDNDGD